MPREDFTPLVDVISLGLDFSEEKSKDSTIRASLDGLFEARYYERSKPKDAFRDAYGLRDEGVPWAGVIAPHNPISGAYGGASLAWFPCHDGTLMTFVVGTRGLAPDEGLLTRHGHRRRVAALRQLLSKAGVVSWSKADPAAITAAMPEAARRQFGSCSAVIDRYGDVIYAASWIPKDDRSKAELVIRAYFDLYARERGWRIRAGAQQEFETLIGPCASRSG